MQKKTLLLLNANKTSFLQGDKFRNDFLTSVKNLSIKLTAIKNVFKAKELKVIEKNSVHGLKLAELKAIIKESKATNNRLSLNTSFKTDYKKIAEYLVNKANITETEFNALKESNEYKSPSTKILIDSVEV